VTVEDEVVGDGDEDEDGERERGGGARWW